MNLPSTLIITLGITLTPMTLAQSDSKQSQQARTVMARSLASDDGYGNSVAEYRMQLADRSGRVSSRELALRVLEATEQHEERSIVVFHKPRDLSGTALLSHARTLDDDLQWLYLPSLRRTKRISGANRSAPFVGSEFAFEDLAPQLLDKYTYDWIRSTDCAERACDVIRRTPSYARSAYSEQHVWIDQKDQQIQKIEFFNRAGQKHKTLTFHNYVHHENRYWRPQELRMLNHLNGKQTELQLLSIRFGTELSAGDFEKSNLDRVDR